jgi:hypothetical protein
MKKKKIVAIIEGMIADLQSGKQVQHWDVPHKPTEAEQAGRVKMLEKLIEQIQGDKE